jgi:hypothetical protein
MAALHTGLSDWRRSAQRLLTERFGQVIYTSNRSVNMTERFGQKDLTAGRKALM